MSFKYRLRKIEKTVNEKDGFRPDREIFWWEPTDPESTRFVHEQTFEVHYSQRKYQIRIVGEPAKAVFAKLAHEILPEKENLKKLSDDEITICMEKYFHARQKAIDDSRRKLGFFPLPAGVAEETIGRE